MTTPAWLRSIATLDLRALALLRMALAVLILADLAGNLPQLQTFYTDDGIMPRDLLIGIAHRTYFNLYFAAESVWGVALLHALAALAALALLVGYQTRWATLVSWALHIALANRNPWLLDGGDLQMRLALFWGFFLPLGARASIDSLRHPSWSTLPNAYSSPATLAYLLQIGLVYLIAGLAKSDGVWLVSGDALYYTFNQDVFATGLARWARSDPSLLRPLTFGALGVEFLIPLLLWLPRLRVLGLALLSGFHLAIASCLQLGLMVPIALGTALGLLPAQVCEALLGRASSKHWRALLGWCSTRLPQSQSGCLVPPAYVLRWPTRLLVWLGCLYIVYINAAVLQRNPRVPMPIQVFGYAFQLFQSWSMFAPSPGDDDGWFVIEGVCINRKSIDLLQNGRPVLWSKPDDVSARIPNQKWRCWFLNLRTHNLQAVNQHVLKWASDRWNATHQGDERLYFARLVYIAEPTPPPGQPIVIHAEVMAEQKIPAVTAP